MQGKRCATKAAKNQCNR